jgi:dipeptidase E
MQSEASFEASGTTPAPGREVRRILAIGGGGFLMEAGPSPIDRYILSIVAKPRPRICYLGTPSGDMPDGIEKFHRAFAPDVCEPTHLAFFRKPSPGSVSLAGYEEHLAVQDVIFVSGGSTKSCLGVWREWKADAALARAYRSGVMLCGMSAGAICWFTAGWTDSVWGAGFQPLGGLGLLPGGCAVHYDAPDGRKRSLRAAVQAGIMPATIAIDDYAAVLFENERPARVLRWGPGGGACRVSADGSIVSENAVVSGPVEVLQA